MIAERLNARPDPDAALLATLSTYDVDPARVVRLLNAALDASRLQDTRDWIVIGAVLIAVVLAVFGYLAGDNPALYALAAGAAGVGFVGFALWFVEWR